MSAVRVVFATFAFCAIYMAIAKFNYEYCSKDIFRVLMMGQSRVCVHALHAETLLKSAPWAIMTAIVGHGVAIDPVGVFLNYIS
jgi:hypothetical protein